MKPFGKATSGEYVEGRIMSFMHPMAGMYPLPGMYPMSGVPLGPKGFHGVPRDPKGPPLGPMGAQRAPLELWNPVSPLLQSG